MMGEYAHAVTGIDIHPGATIGKYFSSTTAPAWSSVRGTTPHRRACEKSPVGHSGGHVHRGGQTLRGVKRHPTWKTIVTIYSGASIFGGENGYRQEVHRRQQLLSSPNPFPQDRGVSIKNPELCFKKRR
jgi:serine O-acetyltransferase